MEAVLLSSSPQTFSSQPRRNSIALSLSCNFSSRNADFFCGPPKPLLMLLSASLIASLQHSDTGVPTLAKATRRHLIPTRLDGNSDTGLLCPGIQK